MNRQPQITDIYSDFTHNIEFEPAKLSMPRDDQKGLAKTYRIPVQMIYPDNRPGPLIVCTPTCFSRGVQKMAMNGKDNYSLHTILWDSRKTEEQTREERLWVNRFNDMIEYIKEYLLMDETKMEIGQPDLEKSDLRKFNPLYYIRDQETKKLVEGAPPRLYCKFTVIEPNSRRNFLAARFYDGDGNKLDPMDLIGKQCMVQAALRVESIWVGGGGRITLQLKLHEASVELLDRGNFTHRLLSGVPVSTHDDDEVGGEEDF
jgi:hypothetical protein